MGQVITLGRALAKAPSPRVDPSDGVPVNTRQIAEGAQRAKSPIKRNKLKTGDRRKGGKVRISPYLRRRTAQRREPTKLKLDGLGFSEQSNPVVSADFIPQGPRLGHCLHITPHDRWGRQESKNRDLRDSAEEELFFTGTFKPCSGPLRVDVAAPEKRQPDVGIKEIQDVHRSARSSDPPSDHPRRSTETSRGGSEDACLPRG